MMSIFAYIRNLFFDIAVFVIRGIALVCVVGPSGFSGVLLSSAKESGLFSFTASPAPGLYTVIGGETANWRGIR